MTDARSIDPSDLLQHTEWLTKLARSLVRDSNTAEDLAQETLVKALRSPPSSARPLRPWLATVLRNLRVTRVRDDSRRQARERAASRVDVASQAAGEMAEATETLSVLISELHKLEEPLRTVVSLRYMRELNSNQIAIELGIPAGTVRWRLKRGLDLLRENLDSRFGGAEESRARLILLVGPAVQNVGSSLTILFGVLLSGLLGWWVVPWTAIEPGALPRTVSIGAAVSDQAQSKPHETNTDLPETAARVRTPLEVPSVQLAKNRRMILGASQAAVEVRVVAPDGAPIAGARFAWQNGKDAWTYSNQGGWAVLKFRPPGDRVRVSFSISDGGCATRIVGADVKTGEWTLLGSVTLVHTQVIQGRVVDEEGVPVPNAILLISPASLERAGRVAERIGPEPWREYRTSTAITLRDGRFRLTDVPNLPVRVWAAQVDTLFAATEPIVDGADEVVLRLKPLSDANAIEGVILGRKGEPVPHAFLHSTPHSTQESRTHPSRARLSPAYSWSVEPPRIETDAAGRFRFVPRELVPYDLTAEDPEDRWQDVHIEAVTPGTRGVRLQFLYELE